MLLIPAIDLKGGRCVRLTQGQADAETVYFDDPVDVASRWVSLGATRLHIIDLDGAFIGTPQNLAVVEKILSTVDVPIQLGGGLRDLATIQQVLELGVQWVILGTRAAQDSSFLGQALDRFPGQIIVGVDAKNGQVATHGWVETMALSAPTFVSDLSQMGAGEIIFTDVSRDGTLQGPNLEALASVLGLGVSVIAAGGIATLDDLNALATLKDKGLTAAILGKSIYAGSIDLSEALKIFPPVSSS